MGRDSGGYSGRLRGGLIILILSLLVAAWGMGPILRPISAAAATPTCTPTPAQPCGWGVQALTPANSESPAPTQGLSDLIAIAGSGIGFGTQFTLALKADGTVWAWGNGFDGQLGNGKLGDAGSSATPVQVSGLSGVVAIAAGAYDGYALRQDGTVWAWGSNSRGQLGTGAFQGPSNAIPAQVSGLTSVVAIAASVLSARALTSDGGVWSWGDGDLGALGLGDNPNPGSVYNVPTPTRIPGLTNVSTISGGHYNGYALKTDGTVWAWGDNGGKQLGRSDLSNSFTPLQVPGLSGITALASHSAGGTGYALAGDSTVWAWGVGAQGQLGNGVTPPSNDYSVATPARVVGLSGVKGISASQGDGYALLGDGTVRSWGSNFAGALGNGTNDSIAVSPTQVLVAGVSAVLGGYSNAFVVGMSEPPRSRISVSLTAVPNVRELGGRVGLIAMLTDMAGKPVTDRLVTFRGTAGPAAGSFAAIVSTDQAGAATTELGGRATGVDVIQAWLDSSPVNGIADPGEPSATVSVTWTYPAASGGVSVSPNEGPPGTGFRFRYTCPSGTSPSLSIITASGSPVGNGFTIGIPTSNGGTTYTQGVTTQLLGTFIGVAKCNNVLLGQAPFTVTDHPTITFSDLKPEPDKQISQDVDITTLASVSGIYRILTAPNLPPAQKTDALSRLKTILAKANVNPIHHGGTVCATGEQLGNSDLKIFVDSQDVTPQATFNPASGKSPDQSCLRVVYDRYWLDGSHSVRLFAQTPGGTSAEHEWSFTVKTGYALVSAESQTINTGLGSLTFVIKGLTVPGKLISSFIDAIKILDGGKVS